MNKYLNRAHEQIANLTPYQPGLSMQSLKERGQDSIIKLASNENPLGMSPKAKQAVLSELDNSYLYPEHIKRLIRAIAVKHNVLESQCILGCGSENIIAMLLQTFNRPENHCLIPQYGFSAYRINAQALNVNHKIIACPDLKLTVEAVLQQVTEQTAMVFIDNPSNPLGFHFSHQQIVQLLEQLPSETLLVLDEAYCEYAAHLSDDYPDSLALQQHYPNLICLRTFSKVYGLAGLRIGYGLFSTEVAELVERVRFPFNVSSLAITAAEAALDDADFIQAALTVNQQGMHAYQNCFDALGLAHLPSVTNFITVDLQQDSDDFIQTMLNQGIIFRSLKPYQLPNHVRISIGTDTQNQRAIQAIKNYFQS